MKLNRKDSFNQHIVDINGKLLRHMSLHCSRRHTSILDQFHELRCLCVFLLTAAAAAFAWELPVAARRRAPLVSPRSGAGPPDEPPERGLSADESDDCE